MRRFPFPDVDVRTTFLLAFFFAELLLLTGTWQLAWIAGFVAGMLSSRASRASLLGALAVAVAWSAYLVYVFVAGQGLQLADLAGQILGMGPGSWWLLTAMTLLLGILVGAVGAVTGYAGSRLFLWTEPPAAPDSPKG
ncbi:MAG TPA: hypothetical protein VI999_05255 [Thermoplasmata archaeon]|nr:hypothetical protein [Thermoplasmata archaeon]